MKHKMLAVLGLSLALAPLAAQAHDRDHDGDWDDDDDQVQTAPPQAQPGGHYEWRSVNQWVPAQAQQYVVPGSCFTRGWGWHHRTFCSPSHYETRVIPGHYIQGGQWVWVADPAPVYPQYPDPDQYPQYPDSNEQYAPDPAPQQYQPAPTGGFDLRVGPRGVRVGLHVHDVAAR